MAMGQVGTVSIQGNSYDIYGTYADAIVYFNAATHAASWTAATQANRLKALVTATRMMDRQPWQGSPTDPTTPQPLEWPRTGVIDRSGEAVDDSEPPDKIEWGTYELANALLGDATVQTDKNSGSNVKRDKLKQKVGPLEEETETEYFVSTSTGSNASGRFPTIVQELVKEYLQAGAGLMGIYAAGTDIDSYFEGYDWGRSQGLR
jgi:hypothetical protein